MRTIPKLLVAISATFVLSASVYADPVTCEPKMSSPPSQDSTPTSWFESLFTTAAKPASFSRVIGATRDPEDGCTGGVELRPVAGDYRNRSRGRSLN